MITKKIIILLCIVFNFNLNCSGRKTLSMEQCKALMDGVDSNITPIQNIESMINNMPAKIINQYGGKAGLKEKMVRLFRNNLSNPAVEENRKLSKRLHPNASVMERLNMFSCAGCRRGGVELQVCSRCKNVKYCGRDCQKKHWKIRHRQVCKASNKLSNEKK
jgi:hypothetical protein